jgi:hypothetical protein
VSALVLSSCSQKFGLQKRKYTKGYYFASSGNNAHSQTRMAVKKEFAVAENIAAEENTEASEPVLASSSIPAKSFAAVKRQFIRETSRSAESENLLGGRSPAAKPLAAMQQPDGKASKGTSKLRVRKGPLVDFLFDAYVGYLIVTMIIGFILFALYMISIFGITTGLLIVGACILLLCIFAAIGGAVM